jgi:hypothetical protein
MRRRIGAGLLFWSSVVVGMELASSVLILGYVLRCRLDPAESPDAPQRLIFKAQWLITGVRPNVFGVEIIFSKFNTREALPARFMEWIRDCNESILALTLYRYFAYRVVLNSVDDYEHWRCW